MINKEAEEAMKRWREAANILAADPTAKVKCPECNNGYLKVKDEIIKQWNKLDRYMRCDNCGKWNVMTMDIPENYSPPQNN